MVFPPVDPAKMKAGPGQTRQIISLCCAGLLLYAAAAMAASFIPYGWVAGLVMPFSGTGDADAFSPAVFAAMTSRCREAGLGVLVCACALCFFRARVAGLIHAAFRTDGSAGSLTAKSGFRPFGRLERGEAVPLMVLIVISILGLALRAAFLDQSMRHDESWTYNYFVRMPFAAIPLRYTDPNNHILHTLLVKLSVMAFGDSPPAIRLPAFAFGTALIPVAAGFTRAIAGRTAMLFAAALIATSSPLVEFSANARGYSAVFCFVIGMFWSGFEAVRTGSRTAWFIYGLCGVLGAYTYPGMATPAAAASVWVLLLLFARRKGTWPPRALGALIMTSTIMCAAIALLYLPVLAVNGWHALTQNSGVHVNATLSYSIARLPDYLIWLLSIWGRDYTMFFSIVLIIAIPTALLFHPNRSTLNLLLPALLAAAVWHLIFIKDLYFPRFWLPWLIVFLILCAAGLDVAVILAARYAHPRWARVTGAAAALLIATWTGFATLTSGTVLASDETSLYPDAAAVASAVTGARSGDMLDVPVLRMDEIVYYLRRDGVSCAAIQRDGDRQMLRCTDARQTTPASRPALFVVQENGDPAVSTPDAMRRAGFQISGETVVRQIFHSAATTVTRVEQP